VAPLIAPARINHNRPRGADRAPVPFGQTIRLERHETLYLNGDPARSVFLVRDGLVRMTRITPEGRTVTVRHAMPGDFFGEEALTAGERSEIAEAMTKVSLDAIDPERIEAGHLVPIAESLSDQMRRLIDHEYHLQTGNLRARVAHYLLLLSKTALAGIDASGRVFLAVTHELIAEGAASTRETVSKIITGLKEDGLIRPGYRSIVLLDEDGLGKAALATHKR
jgi:CRP-like cAMP-binding protein